MNSPFSRFAFAASLAALASFGVAATAQAGDVSVAVNVNTPGIYGQITLGGFAAPELILPRPIVVVPTRVVVGSPPEPLYLHVPPGHEKHWAKHCREYDACGRPVYFVSDHWYRNVYVPGRPAHEREHEEHGHGHDHDHDHDRDHDRDHDHDHENGHERDGDRH